MPLIATDAVVLHAFDYLETSRIFRLATREAGVVSVLARGARSSKRRFGAALDLFASGVAQVQSREGRDLHQLVGFDLGDARHPLSLDLERFAAASAIAEMGLRFASEEEGGTLFATIVGALDAVAIAPAARVTEAGLAGAWQLVAALGFSPVLDRCTVCHGTVEGDEMLVFSHAAGGVVCMRCAPSVPRGRSLPSTARAAIRAWLSGGAEDAALDDATRRAHQRLLREFLERHLSDGKELRAFESWERGVVIGGRRA